MRRRSMNWGLRPAKVGVIVTVGLAALGLFVQCVGDDPGQQQNDADAGTDAPVADTGGSDSQSATDSGSPDAADAAVPCVIADAGPAGSLDPQFATGLKSLPVAAGNGTYDTETGAIDSMGRIYVIGRKRNCVGANTGFDISVMRLSANGALDASFNGGKGYACFDNGDSDSVLVAYVDSSDRLVFGGHTVGTNGAAMVGRMLASGSLDPAFASGSLLTFNPESPAFAGSTYTVYGITPDGDGMIVSGSNQHPFVASSRGFVVRLSGSGVLDTSTFVPYIATDIRGFRGGHIKVDGKLYIPAQKTASEDWTLVILDNKGAPAAAGGLVAPSGALIPQGIVVSRVAGTEDQLFVVGGASPSSGVGTWWTKAGLPTGPLPGFNNSFWDPAYQRGVLVSQCDGKVLVGIIGTDTPRRPAIVRLADRTGGFEQSWGSGGVANLAFDAGTAQMGGLSILERSDGRLVVLAQTNALDGAWVAQLLP